MNIDEAISRRELLRRGGIAVGVLSIPGLLAACGSEPPAEGGGTTAATGAESPTPQPIEGAKIKVMYVEIATYDVEAVREALVTKFGKPKAESDDVIEWRKNGASITAELYGEGLSILLQK